MDTPGEWTSSYRDKRQKTKDTAVGGQDQRQQEVEWSNGGKEEDGRE
jgi:hypothetical protein